jgi:hypothetical protein
MDQNLKYIFISNSARRQATLRLFGFSTPLGKYEDNTLN